MVCCNKYKCHSVEMSEQLIKNVSLPCSCNTACRSAQLQDCGKVEMKLWLKIQHCKNINSACKQNLYRPALSFCFVVLCSRQDVSCSSEHILFAEDNKHFSHLRRVEVVPGLSPCTTGSSLLTFHHLGKQGVPPESIFLLAVQLFFLSLENFQPLPGPWCKQETRGRSQMCFCWVHLKHVCVPLCTSVSLSLSINTYRLIFLDQINSSNIICLVSWSTGRQEATFWRKWLVPICLSTEVLFPKFFSVTTGLACTSWLHSVTSEQIHAVTGSFLLGFIHVIVWHPL